MSQELRERVALPASLVLIALEAAMSGRPNAKHTARALGGMLSDDRETAVLGALGYFTQVSFLDAESDPEIEYYQDRLKDIGVLVFEHLKISNDDLDVLDETIRRKSANNEKELKTALMWLGRFRDTCRAIRFKEPKAAKGG